MTPLFFSRLSSNAFGAVFILATFSLASVWFRTPAWNTYAIPVYLATLGMTCACVYAFAALQTLALNAPSKHLSQRYRQAALGVSGGLLVPLALAAFVLYMVPASAEPVALAAKGLGLFSCGLSLAAMWGVVQLRKPSTAGMLSPASTIAPSART